MDNIINAACMVEFLEWTTGKPGADPGWVDRPLVKPRKVTSFTMILYNSENNIDPSNIWTFNLLVHGTCLDL